ncbi:unnamed protein product [Closterium sp. NIES-64]|nr:unnamed protein product [Closterium sp. NIES-64]
MACLAASSQVAFRGVALSNSQAVSSTSVGKNAARRSVVRCKVASPGVEKADASASAGEYTPTSDASTMNLMSGAINALFGFQPFFRFAAGKAREMMVKRGDAIGFPWAPRLAELKRHDWDEELRLVAATSRVPRDASGEYVYPEYYTKPFHAYEKGNLSLDAALEVELAAKAVHAPVFDPESKTLDPEGDANLRRGYHAKLVEQLRIQPKHIVDLGCASGLSTFALAETFPEAEFIGVDLSPYFVAASNYNVREKSKQAGRELPFTYIHAAAQDTGLPAGSGRELPFTFIHAAAEDTGLPAESVDLVSICLVCHELPRSATKKVRSEQCVCGLERGRQACMRVGVEKAPQQHQKRGLRAGWVNLVSRCPMCHELARSANTTRMSGRGCVHVLERGVRGVRLKRGVHGCAIIEEAHRILRPGGAFAVMEMNPRSPFFQKISNNPFTFAAFKATEPYLDDYRTFPIEDAIAERGFEYPQQMESSPRHRCIVAHKL